MSIQDCVSMTSKTGWTPSGSSEHNQVFERLLSAWISAVAAMVFFAALILAAVDAIEWLHVAYVYISITVVTLLLAALVYASKTSD